MAAEIVDDKQSNKAVIQQQSRRTQRLVNKRRQAVAAAGADVKGEVNERGRPPVWQRWTTRPATTACVEVRAR